VACNQSIKSPSVPQLEGDLATAWERPDPQTIVFTLAPNIKFQNVAPLNGRPLTVDDIKFTFDRGKSYAKGFYTAFFKQIAGVEDVGGGKVRLRSDGPNP